MSKIFINIPNNSIQIDTFTCTLDEFKLLEPTFAVPCETSEIECNSDELLRQCRKDISGTAFGISEDLRFQLLGFIYNIDKYISSLAILRSPSKPVLTLGELKYSKIISVKNEAAKRISKLYPQYRQNNILGAVALIHNDEMIALKNGSKYNLSEDEKAIVNKAKDCNEYILLMRRKSNELEVLVNEKSTKEELDSMEVSDNIFWE
jgi:hypothetical protein